MDQRFRFGLILGWKYMRRSGSYLVGQGQGQWVGGKLQFNGEATCAPEHQAALANLLNIIGRRSGARSIIKLG